MKSNKNEEEENSMLYISFNQDNSFFSIGTEKGFSIYRTEPFTKEPYVRDMNGGIGIVEMIENSNFLALMGGGKIPRYDKKKVVIYDDNLNKEICELKFANEIKLVKYKKNYLFIVGQIRIFIFDFDTYENICEIDTGDNTKELIAINKNQEPSLIAYPAEGSENKNKISIKDYLNKDKQIKTFKLQDDSVSKISFNNDGRLIASASEFGRIIRIHNCEDGLLLMEFNRGREKAKINTICFDDDTKFMAVSSSRGTIHIFSMGSTMHELNQHKENVKKKIIEVKDIINKDYNLINNDIKDNKGNKDENDKKENKDDNNKNEGSDKNLNEIKNENKIDEVKNENKNEEIKKENEIEEVNIENKKEEIKNEIIVEEVKDENEKEEEKVEYKVEEIKDENKEKDAIKIEEVKVEYKVEEVKDENKIEEITDEIKKEEIKIENKENEDLKKEKEDENIINQDSNKEINNIESEKEINKNEINEKQENKEEEQLPENTKSFFGNLFGSRIEKSFARVRLEKQESICAFINKDELAIVTSNYKFYKYLIQKGDCKKVIEEDIKLN